MADALSNQAFMQQGELSSSNNNGDDDGNKRKRSENGGTSRSKRTRYVSLACNECKRRKIRCNGQNPCERCGNMNLECVYAPNCCGNSFASSAEYRGLMEQIAYQATHIQHQQAQLDALRQDLAAHRRATGHELPPQEMYQPAQSFASQLQAPEATMISDTASPPEMSDHSRHQSYRESAGHGVQAYNFSAEDTSNEVNIAQNGLNAMPAQQEGEGLEEPIDPEILHHTSKDPIWSLNVDEALRLCRVYQDEIGLIYPILNIDKVSQQAVGIFRFMAAGTKSGMFRADMPGTDGMYDEDTDIIKLVLSIAMLCDGNGQSALAQRLLDSVLTSGKSRKTSQPSLKGIQITSLTAIFYFLSNNKQHAWKVLCLASRLAVELGLHLAVTHMGFASEQEKIDASTLFGCVYVLDRRWSFATGSISALSNDIMDPNLPDLTDASPYLTAMISLSSLGGNISKCIAPFKSSIPPSQPVSCAQMRVHSVQLDNWYINLPHFLQYDNISEASADAIPDRSTYRLQLLLFLCCNQMQIGIYRPALHSANVASCLEEAKTAVHIASSTICLLAHLAQTSDIYAYQQMTFNHFLISALGVLFLAASNSPAHFAESCRQEYYQALDLVRGFSEDSYASKELWRTIKGLEDVEPKVDQPPDITEGVEADNTPSFSIGPESSTLEQQQYQHHDAHSSAAMGLAALAGYASHIIDEDAFLVAQLSGVGDDQHTSAQGNEQNPGTDTEVGAATGISTNPQAMADELANLYEQAGAKSLSWAAERQVGSMIVDLF